MWAKIKGWLAPIGLAVLAVLGWVLHQKGVQKGVQKGRDQVAKDNQKIIEKIESVQEAKNEVSKENVANNLFDHFNG